MLYAGNVSDLRTMSSADACTKDADARTPLHLAAASADAEHARQMVALLLEKGSDVHAQDKDGWTPLFYAAEVRMSAVWAIYKFVTIFEERLHSMALVRQAYFSILCILKHLQKKSSLHMVGLL